jgi:4'-phosphopantetheinyl transferase EntD
MRGVDGGVGVFARLLPDAVRVVESTEPGAPAELRPAERVSVLRAVEKRQREFAAGRSAARRALAALGIPDATLPVGPGHLPLWPEAIVGSITHCAGFCAAGVARREELRALGLDAEVGEGLAEELVALVCRQPELVALRAQAVLPSSVAAKLVFSAKESVYKCFYPLARRFLDFHEVEVELALESSGAGTFVARVLGESPPSLARFSGRFARDAERVYTAVALLA